MPGFTSIREWARPPSNNLISNSAKQFNFEFCEMRRRCGRGGASYSARKTTGSLRSASKGRSDAINDAAEEAAAEAEIMEPADAADEMGEGQAYIGSGAAQSPRRPTSKLQNV